MKDDALIADLLAEVDPDGRRVLAKTLVLKELRRAKVWPDMNSAHEGFAVLLEEVDELWDHVKVKQNKRDIPAMTYEAVQVAAMAMRFIIDVCRPEVAKR